LLVSGTERLDGFTNGIFDMTRCTFSGEFQLIGILDLSPRVELAGYRSRLPVLKVKLKNSPRGEVFPTRQNLQLLH
jgi:hypothetical protein